MGTLHNKLQELPDEFDEKIDRSGAQDPRVGIAAAFVLAALVAGASFVIIRRRRRRPLMKRLKTRYRRWTRSAPR